MTKTALALLIAKSLIFSFEYQENCPTSLFPYNNAASDDLPLGHLSNPAYLPLWETLYVNIDYGKPYMMDEINSGNLRMGYGFHDLAIQASWNRFGIDEYREDTLSGSIGFMPWKYISTGLTVSCYYIDINTEDLEFSQGLTDVTLALLLRPFDWLNISYIHENVYTAFHDEREDLLYPNMSFGISVKPTQGITFVWNINKLYYDYLNSFIVSANLLSSLCVKAGYSKETSSYAASIIFQYNRFNISYGLNHHPYLGLTHKLGLTINSVNLPFEQVNYNKRLFKKSLPEVKKKININKCSLDELNDAELFSNSIAERIIKYRKLIGPINKKALLQIGVAHKELKRIEDNITGLAPDAGKKEKIKKKKFYKYKRTTRKGFDIDTRKILFQKLIERGIGASIALRITEIAKYNNRKGVILKVKKIAHIQKEKKNLIIKICNDTLQ